MTLQKKSLTDLRKMAQAMGMLPRLDIGKEHLIQEIQSYAGAKVQPTPLPIQINIKDVSANPQTSPVQIEEALKDLKQFGLRVSFPDIDTWEMECDKKKDSGTMRMPLYAIISCAKELIKP